MISLPPLKKWNQNNSGEVFGVLHQTRNLNFDQEGYLKLARKPIALLNAVSNFGSVISIDYLNVSGISGYYMMTSNQPFVYNTGAPTTATSLSGTGHTGGLNFDGLIWQNRWYISQDTTFAYYASGATWTTGLGSLTSSVPHPLCVFENLNNLAIGNGNSVILYDTTHTSVKVLTLPSNFEVRWMVWKNNNLYIGTRNASGGKAFMFIWDGSTTSANSGYQVDGAWLFAGCAYLSTVAVFSSNGQLLKFNGGGFDVLDNLPVYYTSFAWYNNTGYINGKIEHRGMVADGDQIYINIDTSVASIDSYLPNSPGGLHQYDPKVGLYHKGGWGLNKFYYFLTVNMSVNAGTGVFTSAVSFTAPSGTLVGYSGDVGGLVTNSYYYLIRLSSTTFKLATTYANAIAGISIALTSAGTVYNFSFSESDEAGRVYGSPQPGAVGLISDLDGSSTTYQGMDKSIILYANRAVDNDTISGSVAVLNTLVPGLNIGSFVTQKIYSQNITDTFAKIVEKFSRLEQTCDKITIKYRSKKVRGLPIIATGLDSALWVSATQFTTTKDLTNASIGDEIEIIDGRCSGYNVHILSTPTYNSGTGLWTVNIDETLPNVAASDKSLFVIDNWKKLTTVTSSAINNIASQLLQGDKPWIQLKGEIRGVSEPVIEEIQVINKYFKPSI